MAVQAAVPGDVSFTYASEGRLAEPWEYLLDIATWCLIAPALPQVSQSQNTATFQVGGGAGGSNWWFYSRPKCRSRTWLQTFVGCTPRHPEFKKKLLYELSKHLLHPRQHLLSLPKLMLKCASVTDLEEVFRSPECCFAGSRFPCCFLCPSAM